MRLILLFMLSIQACSPWTAEVTPSPRIWTGDQAFRLLDPCTRRSPGPIDSLWTPTPEQVAQLEQALPAYLQKHWHPPEGGAWLLTGEFAGYFRAGRALIYGSFVGSRDSTERLMSDRVATRWCDGGGRFFGVQYDPATGDFLRLDANESVSVGAPWPGAT